MARKKVSSKKAARGIRITPGSKWTLTDVGGTHRQFRATVLYTRVIGGRRIALLSVPARVREQRLRRRRKA